MKNQDLVKQQAEIDRLFAKLSLLQRDINTDEEVLALLTFHLVIRVSGFIENCVRIIFMSFASSRVQDQVATYVNSKLEKFPNPTYGNMLGLLEEFDKQWASDFKARIRAKKIPKTSLENININRNLIAHGKASTITLTELRGYFDDVLQLIEQLEECVVSNPAASQALASS